MDRRKRDDRRNRRDDTKTAAADRRAERELHAHFAGRRDAERTETLLECRISGGRGAFRALAVDMSRAGALIRVTDSRFTGIDGEDALMQFSFRVGAHFADGMTLAFLGGALFISADVVRVTSRVEEQTQMPSHLIGVRFRPELTKRHCESLAIADRDDAPLAGYLDDK